MIDDSYSHRMSLTLNHLEYTDNETLRKLINVPIWHRRRLILAGLEPVLTLGQTEKPCIASYKRQFFENNKNKLMQALILKPFISISV